MQRPTLMRIVHGVARIAAGYLALNILLVFGVTLLMAAADDPGSITTASIRLHFLDYIEVVALFFLGFGCGGTILACAIDPSMPQHVLPKRWKISNHAGLFVVYASPVLVGLLLFSMRYWG